MNVGELSAYRHAYDRPLNEVPRTLSIVGQATSESVAFGAK
jgi:hypothetical protein